MRDPKSKLTIKSGVEPLRRSGHGLKVPREPRHPSHWWGITREYGGIKLGAIVQYKGERLRVRRIERLSERPFVLTYGGEAQGLVQVYRDEFELVRQGDGRAYNRNKSGE